YFAGISNIANGTIIGGTNTGEGNIIRNNGSFGVRNQGTGVRILGNAIDANGGIGIDHNSDGVSVNDLNDIDGGANSRQNFPVITSATSSGGNSSITGTLNSNASSNYRIEFFSSPAADPSGYGEGATFLGSVQPVTTNASGNATINANLTGITIPTGHYVTATATNLATNNTSEFSGALLSGSTISGTVFEDVNYGGGAGRDKATALGNGGSGRSGVRVELYDGSGNFNASTTTDASGNYAFSGVTAGSWTVRVVNSSVSSARAGYVAGTHLAVQTYRTTATSGTAVATTDRVGGEAPEKADAGNGTTTLAALSSASTAAQSLAQCTVGSADITGVDFGFNFSTISNINSSGQGSLSQWITNTSDLGDKLTLAQSGMRLDAGVPQPLPAGNETSIFMIPGGTGASGLHAGFVNQLTGGVAVIAPTTGMPAIGAAAGANTNLDGTTQTYNVGNTNNLVTGAGGTVGADGITLGPVAGPEVQLDMSALGSSAITVQANDVSIRGLSILGAYSGNGIQLDAGTSGAIIEQNILGATATSFTDPGSANRNSANVSASSASNATVRNNLIGFAGTTGIYMPSGANNWTIRNNELRDNGIGSTNGDNLAMNTITGGTVTGNLIVGASTQGIVINTLTGATFTNNTISDNGVGTITGMDQSPGVTVRANCSNVTFDRNVFADNFGAGIQVNDGSNVVITHCLYRSNGSVIARNGAAATGQIGIDLNSATDNINFGAAPFFTLNDATDADAGGNGLVNFPTLNSAHVLGSDTRVTGQLSAEANTTYRIEFFHNPPANVDPTNYGEAHAFMSTIDLTTDGTGTVNIDQTIPYVLSSGDRVCATATKLLAGAPIATSEFGQNVVANQPPVAVCQNATVYLNGGGSAAITTAMIDNGSFDPDGSIASLSVNPVAVNCSSVGTVNVTLTVTDNNGLTATCVAAVTVVDNIQPVISNCPGDITVNAGAACTATATWTIPSAEDNCSGYSLVRTAGPAPGSIFPLGNTTVTYTATDASGNTSFCSFAVTVLDVTAPVITGCPSNITVNAGAACTAAATWTVPSFTDNCAGGSIVRTTGPAPGSTFSLGTTNIVYTATDAAGNTSTCAFTVTVVDVTVPVITGCPSNIVLNGDPCMEVATWTAPSVSDNCAGATITQTGGLPSGSAFNYGTHTITYKATDGSGNLATCSFTVTVLDVTAPTIICPADTVIPADAGLCEATNPDLGLWSTSSFCETSTSTSWDAVLPLTVGPHVITYTVTDGVGNASSCTQNVTIVDAEAPVAICRNITVDLGAGSVSISAAQVDNGSADNCIIASTTVSPNTFNAVGTYNVTLTVTDAAGNTDDCVAVVTVTDTDPPVAVCQNITIPLNAAGAATISASQIDGGSTDNGTIVSLVASQTMFTCANLGANNVTLTVTDDGGNTDDCVAVVTVVDNTAPTVTCQNITIHLDAAGNASIVAADINNGSTDNCSIVALNASRTAFTCADLGANAVILSVTDQSGNNNVCTATVTVLDNILPQITCPANIMVSNDPGQCGALVNYVAPVGTDNCGGSATIRTAGPASGSLFPVGTTTVTHQVTDASGQSSFCSFTVTVNDISDPTIHDGPTDIIVDAGGACTAVATWVEPTVSDNCPGASIMQTTGPVSGSAFPLGVSVIGYTATDASGNTADWSFTVTVLD
ncbi:MAG: HYR domain-containing protein, partial [Flavobacteriales bacterium]|nr:HYR domain-containing protein [Flavobacteriales bacterium]